MRNNAGKDNIRVSVKIQHDYSTSILDGPPANVRGVYLAVSYDDQPILPSFGNGAGAYHGDAISRDSSYGMITYP